ncbi:helix-turn-helix domain-containing protein [Mucilaginibacter auburnensis]|uniref:Transcriptional regulator with XRE-family HTH domain n=1 Tax=Mucilaginibacter auburnensis TaxID=1457233 RepID=A0A2H9VRY3_9SPHI|nr:XRE family transcriptional regulator [Mucilaginibacter auburnensis]PJJ83572.1 transcriptional regulator with XRE-family HTH domain [Mucilaginibacter auburnensis]
MEESASHKTLNIGDRIRILRVTQKRTLQELADNCGISKSMVSKIENNKTMPSVATLVKIAQNLGTNVSSLMEQNGWEKAIVTSRAEAESKLMHTEKGYSIFPYASAFHEKKMQPFLFVAKKGEVKPHQLSHDGQEFVYVVEGEMKMTVGDTDYTLRQGDSLYFNAIQKHGIIPVSDVVTYLDIFV